MHNSLDYDKLITTYRNMSMYRLINCSLRCWNSKGNGFIQSISQLTTHLWSPLSMLRQWDSTASCEQSQLPWQLMVSTFYRALLQINPWKIMTFIEINRRVSVSTDSTLCTSSEPFSGDLFPSVRQGKSLHSPISWMESTFSRYP